MVNYYLSKKDFFINVSIYLLHFVYCFHGDLNSFLSGPNWSNQQSWHGSSFSKPVEQQVDWRIDVLSCLEIASCIHNYNPASESQKKSDRYKETKFPQEDACHDIVYKNI